MFNESDANAQILVIESEPSIYTLTHTHMAESPVTVHLERSVTSLLNDQPTNIDVIILDLDTESGNTDITLIDQIKQSYAFCEIPLIVVSSNNDTDLIIGSLNAGADDFVAKPVAPRELMARLRMLMR